MPRCIIMKLVSNTIAGPATRQTATIRVMAMVECPRTEPVQRVSRRWAASLSLANLGLFMAYFGPLGVLLPNQVQVIAGQGHKVVSFGWVTGLGALVAMAANPLAGAWSDRTVSRFGRRRPWVLGGAVASALALFLLARQHTIAGVVLGWCLAQAGMNAMQAGIVASVPDRVPVPQRGAVSGWLGVPQVVGVIAAVFLVTKVVPGSRGYLLLGVLVIGCALPFVVAAREPEFIPRSRGGRAAGWAAPLRDHDFGWAWLTRFLMVLGNSVAVLYLLYFLRDRVRYGALFPGQTAEDGLVKLLLVYTVVVVVTAMASGIVSDRSGRRRRPVMLSGVVMAVPAVLLALWPTWPMVLAASGLLGLGFGVYLSVDQALITQVLPAADGYGRDLGVMSVASSAGQALAPAIAAPVVTYLGGYTALYLCVGAIVLLGSAAVGPIRAVP
jgi:MFS family permease